MQSTMINGVAIHHRFVSLSPGRPTIVFINSLGTDFRIWDAVVEKFSGEYNILLHDKRSHGLSGDGPTPVTMADFVADLEQLLDQHGIRQAVLCGLSIGGIIAIGLAARRPDLACALILCNTAPKVGTPEAWAERIAAVRAGGIEGISEMVLSRWFTPGFRTAGNAAYQMARNMLIRQSAKGYMDTCAALAATDYRADAARLALPAICIAGDHDQATPPAIVKEMSEMIPGSAYRLIAGCGHIPCIERPGELAVVMKEFLDGIAAR